MSGGEGSRSLNRSKQTMVCQRTDSAAAAAAAVMVWKPESEEEEKQNEEESIRRLFLSRRSFKHRQKSTCFKFTVLLLRLFLRCFLGLRHERTHRGKNLCSKNCCDQSEALMAEKQTFFHVTAKKKKKRKVLLC